MNVKPKSLKSGALSSNYLPVYLTDKKTNYFMFGSGPFLFTRKVTIFSDNITFSRSILKPGFTLYKKDIDAIELFKSVAAPNASNLRIIHHAPNVFSPIVVEQYDDDLAALQRANYLLKLS